MTPPPLELHPGRLYRLGGSVAHDGRLTWAPPGTIGYEPVSCYLVRGAARNLLVDTGVAVHHEAVVAQLRQLLGEGEAVSVFLTRAEPDCVMNLAVVAEQVGVEQVYAGGTSAPFDYFDDVNAADSVEATSSSDVPVERIAPGRTIDLSADGTDLLEVLPGAIRLLATWWLVDPVSGYLFSSDSFGHVPADDPHTVVADGSDVDVRMVTAHLLTKFDWLAPADRSKVVQGVRSLGERDLEGFAPTHGCVLQGRETVERHLDAVLRALA